MLKCVKNTFSWSQVRLQSLEKSSLFHNRYNLDPESERTDDDLWNSLEISQLKDTVNQMPKD